MEKEIWKPIPRYYGYYEASNLGRIRSYYTGYGKIKILKPNKTTYRTSSVQLYVNYIRTVELIHYLVLESFTDPKDYKLFIKHLNSNTFDNRLINLKWITNKGDCNNKVIYQYDLLNNFIKEFPSIKSIYLEFNFSSATLYKHLNGYTKTCKGYIFKREKFLNK